MNALQNILNTHHDISIIETHNGLMLDIPFYHEDGDMYEIFVKQSDNGIVTLYDNGLTLMRLSYTFALDTDNKIDIFNRLLQKNGITNTNGILSIQTNEQNFVDDLNQFCIAIAKVTSMDILSKEVVSSLFYEYVDDYLMSTVMKSYPVERNFKPNNAEFFPRSYKISAAKSIILFPIKDNLSASRAALGWLNLKNQDNSFRGLSVCDNLDTISQNDKYKRHYYRNQYNEFVINRRTFNS